MPFPALAAIGIGAGISALGGILSSSAASKAAKRISADPADYRPDTSALDRLIRQRQTYNATREALIAARSMGFEENTFAQNAALRGAGRNAFGVLRGIGQAEARTRMGEYVTSATPGLERANADALAGLISQRLGADQYATSMAFQGRLAKEEIRASGRQALYGGLQQLGGTMAGMGMGSALGMGDSMSNFMSMQAIRNAYPAPTQQSVDEARSRYMAAKQQMQQMRKR